MVSVRQGKIVTTCELRSNLNTNRVESSWIDWNRTYQRRHCGRPIYFARGVPAYFLSCCWRRFEVEIERLSETTYQNRHDKRTLSLSHSLSLSRSRARARTHTHTHTLTHSRTHKMINLNIAIRVQFTLDYSCADYPVCGLIVHDPKLLIINDEGGEQQCVDKPARCNTSCVDVHPRNSQTRLIARTYQYLIQFMR